MLDYRLLDALAAVIETGGFLAAGAFLAPNKKVLTGEMWAGLPARKLRDLKPGEDKMALMGAAHYVENGKRHAEAVKNVQTRLGGADMKSTRECCTLSDPIVRIPIKFPN